ncbi:MULTISPECIES: isopenicillin N synthase family dioxygenase [Burkholderia]|uniref:isopenicillin N synthase family dioxygenase n=1 Tax=Burkholderia TaxID=32008 RepID=UPI000B7AD629|nr:MULTISPECIES: 2OG-Fe(II) oxygenase family protein [Burkholderia]OXI95009.1 oxidoreductase [Burkholderia sp. AU33803]PRD91006.1 isopenicillin N synthase family oxygenase [Burkholderia contaminans]
MKSTEYIPIIDLQRSASGICGDKFDTAQKLRTVCEGTGFFLIVGHGVQASIVEKAYRATQAFFELPLSDKLALRSDHDDPLMRGFGRQGSLSASNTDAVVASERARPDLSETYTINRLGEPIEVPGIPSHLNWHVRKPNKWPDIDGFRAAYLDYYHEMEGLARDLMSLFALSLNLREDWFDSKIDQHMTNLTANYYPPLFSEPIPGQLRKGQHSDWGCLTILYQDGGTEGLQILTKDGNWVDVPTIADAFVINIGDLMSIWTNDRWTSTVHRVVNPPAGKREQSRYSLPFFYQPNFHTVIECIPGCNIDSERAKHNPVKSGDYILEKFSRAYGKY